MSQALVDFRAPLVQTPDLKGQISTLFSSSFSDFSSINNSKIMDSSHANTDPFGFANIKGMGLNKSGLRSAKPGRTRPRLAKERRREDHPRLSTPSLENININPEVNPLQSISFTSFPYSSGAEIGSSMSGNTAFVFGASRDTFGTNFNSMRNSVNGKERSNLAEGSVEGAPICENVYERSGVNENSVSNLRDGIRKLNIDGPGNMESSQTTRDVNSYSSVLGKTHFSFVNGNDVNCSFGTSLMSRLPDELNKLNINNAGEVGVSTLNRNADNTTMLVSDDPSKGDNSLAGSSTSVVPKRMQDLKDANFSANDQSVFDFGSNSFVAGGWDERADNTISDKMRQLKIASEAGGKNNQRQELPENSSDKKSQHTRSSIPTEFTFQFGPQVQTSSGSQIPQSSSGACFQTVEDLIETSVMTRDKKKDGVTRSWDGVGAAHGELKTPTQEGDIFICLDRKIEFNAKREPAKYNRTKKKRGKVRKPMPVQQWPGQDSFLRKESLQENLDFFESYSPMDISPYQETLAEDRGSRETSVASEESSNLYVKNDDSESWPTVSNDAVDEELVFATQCLDINEGDVEHIETKVEGSQYGHDQCVGTAEGASDDSASGAETESFKSAAEQLDHIPESFVTAADSEVSSGSRIGMQDSDGGLQFCFTSKDVGRTSFTFSASSSAQGQSSAAMRSHRKKNRVKIVNESYSSTSNTKVPHIPPPVQLFPPTEASSLSSPRPVQKRETNQETISLSTASIAAQESCEKWRLRGNQAYLSGDMLRAEDYYTKGVNCVSQYETSRSCLRALMLCYSNRAATLMSLGRMREALADCMNAAAIDPNFLRVQLRAANCYLALGEVEDASLHFLKCLQSGSSACVDRKLVVEASEGLEKTQKVSQCIKQSAELLQRRTSIDAETALAVIAEALSTSSYCEKLLEMKADALFMLRKYEDLIQLCEQTLVSAEMNCSTISSDGHSTNMDCSDMQKISSFRLWRWHLITKSYFYLGRLEEALDFLKKQEGSVSSTRESGGKTLESVIPLAGTIRLLVNYKAAGNEAFQSGRHPEAVEHYTTAISCSVESCPFAAVCFCNRAAAYKAMGQILDAIADCSLAIALDGNYLKAVSRRATLFEMIRDYEQATKDLNRLVSLLMKQVEDKANQSNASDRMSKFNELRQAQQRLSTMEEEARKGIPLNMYLILAVDPSVTAAEIKKAYRKAALRHHPDKAGQMLARSESGDEGLLKDVVDEAHKDADRLFKMIGEAYAVLSDSTKRSRYDLEEEMWNTRKRANGGSTSRMRTDVPNYPFEKSSSTNRRQWQEVWRSYGNTQSKGPETWSSRYL
ncbi:hypothetical protein NMG60_11033675 [Bertholletia excelsa]